MPYSYLTFAEAKRLLSIRLSDIGYVFWTEEEMGLYICDALRNWSLLSGYYKDRDTFFTTANEPFYDLTVKLPTLRKQVATDTDLIKLIQYHLMEPATGTSWTGSEQFTYETVLEAIQRVRNKLILEVGTSARVDLVLATPPPVQRVYLDETTVDVLRVAWKSSTNILKNLRRRDATARKSFDPRGSYTPSSPIAYKQADQPHVAIELWPPSIDAGHLEVISSRALGTVTGQGVALGIPDDFIPLLKWGVLADLLSGERAQDTVRSQYCEQRWSEGVMAAKLASSAWTFEINGVATGTASLQELDSFTPNWENITGVPQQVAMVSSDLIALYKVPDDAYSVTCDITRSALIPAGDADQVQIGREILDTFFDYCVHLATFKQGGATFLASQPQFEGFYKAASGYNSRLKAQALYLESLNDHAYREERRRPQEVINSTKGGVA